MRYGVTNFPVRPVIAEIDSLGNLEMDYLELSMDSPMAHHQLIIKHKADILKAIRRRKMGLICHLPTFVYMAHLTESIRNVSIQEVIEALEIAVDLGAEKAVLHPGYIDGLAVHMPDYALALAMEAIEKVWIRAAQLGILLCIENLFPRLGPFCHPDDFKAIFAAFPNIKLVLDVGHANIGDKTGTRVIDFIHCYKDRLGHLHISDNNGIHDEHLPLGQGNINFQTVGHALSSIGYNDTVTLEIFSQDRSILTHCRTKFEAFL
jgi:sugar phosphate isomerase/epimerase